jgi:DNA-binding FadR family transcriptional regulator
MANPETQRLYASVSRDLAGRIAAGEFPIGTRLPTERILSQRYNVSRPTIREAVIALEVDGLVQTRMGSGVFVLSATPKGGRFAPLDMGPFELLEARRAIEGETCALAAARINQAKLAVLDELIDTMGSSDPIVSEAADEQFHLTIARASENSGLATAVEMLFEARHRSPQYRLTSDKAHNAGIFPRVDEHRVILEALKVHDAKGARAAMRRHLARVLDSFMDATANLEVERIQAIVSDQRSRYAIPD